MEPRPTPIVTRATWNQRHWYVKKKKNEREAEEAEAEEVEEEFCCRVLKQFTSRTITLQFSSLGQVFSFVNTS